MPVHDAGDKPGAALARMRREAGVSQGQLAERLRTTQSAIARLEADRLSPSLRTLRSAYAALGSSLLLVPVTSRAAYAQSRRLALQVAEPSSPRYDAGHATAVDMTQIYSSRRLTPVQRLDRLAGAVRGMDDLLRSVRR